MLYFNGFMSAFFTSNLESIIGNGGLIPLNAFTNDNDFTIGKLLGANVSTTAMTMKLSDRISVYPWDAKTGKKLEVKEQISTVDLSQKKTKEIFNHIIDDKVYIMAEDTEFLDISSPLTHEDKDCQWNPTSNGDIDGSNYAYIIDTSVTQSLHQGEERHTFYSDNPFTYQGDYNEISIAQFRYNNMGYLTGNAFNWTTLYKLNHDEYSESEETTFSYPAKILPPSPQNIAKQIVIIPKNPSIEVNIPQTSVFNNTKDKLIWDYNSWIENVVPKIKPLEININFKDYLDPTLLIKTFNDLKRYYKSIDIYLSYEYETNEFINHQTDGCTTTEIFKPSKTQTFIFSRDLKELSIYNQPLKLKYYEKNNITYHGLYAGYYGNGKIGLEIDRNEYKLYSIQSTYMESKIEDNITTQSIQNQKDTILGFCDLSDKEFKWKIQLLPNIMQLELGIFSEKAVLGLIQYIRYYKYYKLNISKIIFNPR
ncbi:hypothetical protein [Spiroplasma endosymbiont of Cleonymus obscurus]|uniref:hypothetical protein n=1 Tax=Spiroplasma endosymbiont of Cleonymus obscurus TaxID=3066324 RepID=UPI0037DC4F8B